MSKLHVVLSNDPAVPVVAATAGDVWVLPLTDPAAWVAPAIAFTLWGTYPGLRSWDTLAARASAVVCWNTDHAARIAGVPVLSPAAVVGEEFAQLLAPAPPTLAAAVRGRGLTARRGALGLPSEAANALVHRPALRDTLTAHLGVFLAAGAAALRGDYAGRSVVRAKMLPGDAVAVENDGLPILVTALLLLRTYTTVVQLLRMRSPIVDVYSRGAVPPGLLKDDVTLVDESTATHARGHLREAVDMDRGTFTVDLLALFDGAMAEMQTL